MEIELTREQIEKILVGEVIEASDIIYIETKYGGEIEYTIEAKVFLKSD